MSGPAATSGTPGAPDPLSSPLDAAQVLTARGWVVFPCDHPYAGLHCTGSARRCRERRCGADEDVSKRGKHPRVRWGELAAPASSAQLAEWFGSDAVPANVAIACGPSGLLVIDEDKDGALRAYAESIGTTVPDTFRVRSSRGDHWYFTVPIDPETGQRVPVGNAPGALAGWGCDVRGGASASAPHGGYVIGPGSRHWTDHLYTAPDPYAVCAVAPGWLIAAVQAPYAGVGPYLGAAGQGPSADAPEGSGGSPRTGNVKGSASATVAAGSGAVQGAPGGTTEGTPGGTGLGSARWTEDVRYGPEAELRAQFARHCAEVVHTGGLFRWELFLAARDGWRLVHKGLLTEDAMLRELAAGVWRVWAAEPDERDEVIVYDEAEPAAIASPWELTLPERISRAAAHGAPEITPDRFARPSEAAAAGLAAGLTRQDTESRSTTDGNRTIAGPTQSEGHLEDRGEVGETPAELAARQEARRDADEYAKVLRTERFRRRAREELAAEGLELVEPDDLDEYLDGPGADYLVPGMVHRDGLAVVFGLPSAGKTYVVLGMCLSFATGEPWALGGGVPITRPDGSPGIVHYVMAEAPRINSGRINGWLVHHGRKRADIKGRFFPITKRFKLTEADIQRYLPAVRRDKPDLVVLDTKNAMHEGSESQGDDIGAMLRVIALIREAADGCAIILVDHPGLNAPHRVRGSNAEEGGTESMIIVEQEKDGPIRRARVTRDKAAPEDAFPEWPFRLQSVEGAPHKPTTAPPAVCVPVEVGDHRPVFPVLTWVEDELPQSIVEKIDAAQEQAGDGRFLAARGKREAKVIMKLLRAITGEAPNQGKILTMINESRADRATWVKVYAVSRGCGLLVDVGLVDDVGTPTVPRYVVASAYSKREMPE